MSDKLNLPKKYQRFYELATGDPKNVYPPFQAKDIITLCSALSDNYDEIDRLKSLLGSATEEQK